MQPLQTTHLNAITKKQKWFKLILYKESDKIAAVTVHFGEVFSPGW